MDQSDELRAQLARWLRVARTEAAPAAHAAIERVLFHAPDMAVALRRRIRLDLELADLESAETLAARCVLRYPWDPTFRELRARCLIRRGRWAEADRIIKPLARCFRRRRGVYVLAARVALARHERDRACSLALEAMKRVSGNHELAAELVAVLIDLELWPQADEMLSRISTPPPTLLARWFIGQGRLLEAMDVLDSAVMFEAADGPASEAWSMLIDLAEQVGDEGRVLRLCNDHDATKLSVVQVRLAEALLHFGHIRSSLRMAITLARASVQPTRSWCTAVVAATLLSRTKLAAAALRRVKSLPDAYDRHVMNECWRRGFHGRVLRAQIESRAVEAGMERSMLRPMLKQAVATFDAALTSGESESDPALHEADRTMCLASLSRRDAPTSGAA